MSTMTNAIGPITAEMVQFYMLSRLQMYGYSLKRIMLTDNYKKAAQQAPEKCDLSICLIEDNAGYIAMSVFLGEDQNGIKHTKMKLYLSVFTPTWESFFTQAKTQTSDSNFAYLKSEHGEKIANQMRQIADILSYAEQSIKRDSASLLSRIKDSPKRIQKQKVQEFLRSFNTGGDSDHAAA